MKREPLQVALLPCNCCCSLIKFLFLINSLLSAPGASMAVNAVALPIWGTPVVQFSSHTLPGYCLTPVNGWMENFIK